MIYFKSVLYPYISGLSIDGGYNLVGTYSPFSYSQAIFFSNIRGPVILTILNLVFNFLMEIRL